MTASHDDSRRGVTRRGFLGTIGAGAVAAAALNPAVASAAAPAPPDPDGLLTIELTVNAQLRRVRVEPRTTLTHLLREQLGLTGTKEGCGRGECGACTVLFDGQPRYSCLTLAVEAAGHDITTVEGLMDGEELGPVQNAFVAEDGMQCGYCTPGQVVAAEGLLRANPDPSDEEIRQGLAGNLCRCGAYDHIHRAVARAARQRRGEAES